MNASSRRGRGTDKNSQDVALRAVADAIKEMSTRERPAQTLNVVTSGAAAGAAGGGTDHLMKEAVEAIEAAGRATSQFAARMSYRRAVRLVIQAGFDPRNELPEDAIEAATDIIETAIADDILS
jgi:hypothetical protein